MGQYKWRDGGPKPPVDADVFGRVIEQIAPEEGALGVKPEAVVEAARSSRSEIHKCFQWDNDKAAASYRIQQARALLGALQIVRVELRDGPTVSNRAYFSIAQNQSRSYVGHDRVMSDLDLRAMVIKDAHRELEAFVKKYQSILALGRHIPNLQNIIDAMRDELEQLKTDATRRGRPAASENKVRDRAGVAAR